MNMTVGQRIKERRQELQMSVDELADKLSKNRSTVYRYENGDIENMPLDILEPIANALRTTPAHLMGWDQEEIDAVSEMQKEANAYMDDEEALLKSFYEDIWLLGLKEEELKELYEYAKYLKSKRE